MKNFVLALGFLSALSLAGCAGIDSGWTPMSSGRTAGESVIIEVSEEVAPVVADKTFNSSLRK